MLCVREARVTVARATIPIQGPVNGHLVSGYDTTVTVTALSDLGVVYTRTATIFVAPHDPRIELRSTRAA
jgi:hypothetical protein